MDLYDSIFLPSLMTTMCNWQNWMLVKACWRYNMQSEPSVPAVLMGNNTKHTITLPRKVDCSILCVEKVIPTDSPGTPKPQWQWIVQFPHLLPLVHLNGISSSTSVTSMMKKGRSYQTVSAEEAQVLWGAGGHCWLLSMTLWWHQPFSME